MSRLMYNWAEFIVQILWPYRTKKWCMSVLGRTVKRSGNAPLGQTVIHGSKKSDIICMSCIHWRVFFSGLFCLYVHSRVQHSMSGTCIISQIEVVTKVLAQCKELFVVLRTPYREENKYSIRSNSLLILCMYMYEVLGSGHWLNTTGMDEWMDQARVDASEFSFLFFVFV